MAAQKPTGAAFGLDETLLTVALVLLTAGLWARVGMVALTAPGLVLLWIALPTRAPLMQPAREAPARRAPQ